MQFEKECFRAATNQFLTVVFKFSPKNRYFQKKLKKSRRKVKDKVEKKMSSDPNTLFFEFFGSFYVDLVV